ncbi:MAG: HEAT repeat domain-containing protein [Chloroflexia bacterium]
MKDDERPDDKPPSLMDQQPDDGQTVEGLVHTLATEKGATRDQAYAALVAMGSQAVLPLIGTLGDENDTIRYYVVGALGDIRDPRAVEPLIQTALNDEDEEVRSRAIEALVEIGDVRAVDPLLHLLQNSQESLIRCFAAKGLGEFRDGKAVEPLIDALLHDRSTSVRESAAQALGGLGDKRAVEPLIQALTSDLSDVEETDDAYEFGLIWYSAWSLAYIGDPRAVEPLIQLLLDHADDLQGMLVIDTLGVLGDRRAVPAIEWVYSHATHADETMHASFERRVDTALQRIKQRQG